MQWECSPPRLEEMCTYLFLNYLHDEMNLIFHLKNFQDRSVLLKQHGLEPDRLIARLETQLCTSLTGILHDIVRQKMVDILISTLHTVTHSIQDLMGVCKPPPVLCKIPENFELNNSNGAGGSTSKYMPTIPSSSNSANSAIHQCRSFPRLQLFELVLHKELRILDFSQNKDWPPDGNEQMQDVSRNLWKIISDRCQRLEKLIIPKELTYSSTMNKIFLYGGSHLTHLTLKRNVPNNQFLSLIGQHCPKIRELDIAGADVVTDFGVICLLFEDPEQIFLECWNREKTVGSIRRSQKSFPHPHFDKPIPDPTEHTPGHQGSKSNTQYLHLKKSFYEAIRDTNYFWQKLPICNSLQKLRLENTKVKADGASVVLWCCKNIFSLGYLVFAAAGLKTVFGYEEHHDTKFTEIFYRGPSDQKLQTIQNTCPKLKTMFLGSNSVRHLNASVFKHWPYLEYLTLENIIVDDVSACLELIGKQLKGLKIQCTGFDIMEIGEFCPNLVSLIIQKECPYTSMKTRNYDNVVLFPRLLHLEITASFPKVCFSLIMKNAPVLKSVKVFELPGLRKENLMEWIGHAQSLETLIIFRAPELGKDAVDLIMDSCPKLSKLGDLQDMKKSQNDMKRLLQRIRDENWNLKLIDSQQGSDEKDFNKLLTLHWFYLTECPSQSYISKE